MHSTFDKTQPQTKSQPTKELQRSTSLTLHQSQRTLSVTHSATNQANQQVHSLRRVLYCNGSSTQQHKSTFHLRFHFIVPNSLQHESRHCHFFRILPANKMQSSSSHPCFQSHQYSIPTKPMETNRIHIHNQSEISSSPSFQHQQTFLNSSNQR